MHDPLGPPIAAVRAAVARALDEDLTPLGDITSALLPADLAGGGRLRGPTPGVLAGIACATEAFAQIDPSVEVNVARGRRRRRRREAGARPGAGAAGSILTAERTALNFLVPPLGRRHARHGGSSTRPARAAVTLRIWDTRKTTPGLRALEKAAVRAGGGVNHRGNLSDWVLLKDNHLAHLEHRGRGAPSATRRGRRARSTSSAIDLSQVERALAAGADALLLDNMTPDEVRECVAAADRHAVARRQPSAARSERRRHARDRRPATPRPASTASRRARSRRARRCSTSASTSRSPS